MSIHNPILNNPYEEPQKHYDYLGDRTINWAKRNPGRKLFERNTPESLAKSKTRQLSAFDNDQAIPLSAQNDVVNLLRKYIKEWREQEYPSVTRVTKELLTHWFLNPEKNDLSGYTKRVFFAQREAIETTIWLNEVASRSNEGNNILFRLSEYQKLRFENISGKMIDDYVLPKDFQMPRFAFKMATGTGKTTVMGLQIIYHFFNRQEYKNDIRFVDYFLIIVPNLTIKDRLSELKNVDDKRPDGVAEYRNPYFKYDLVPPNYRELIKELPNRVEIHNYHTFEPKTAKHQGATDGRQSMIVEDGEVKYEKKETAKETTNATLKRKLPRFKPNSRLLILNDEAHHCYFPKIAGKNTEDGDFAKEENQRASVWIHTILQLRQRFQVNNIYDLSATPYFLNGSGYPEGLLFPWVVTSFGLIEAIESGLVKIPFLPDDDDNYKDVNTTEARNLYKLEEVRKNLPKGNADLDKLNLEQPRIPPKVKNAWEGFYKHYKEQYQQMQDLYQSHPVMIIVCANKAIANEVYRYVAGFEQKTNSKEGEANFSNSEFPLFSNYELDLITRKAKPKEHPATMIVNAYTLDRADEIVTDEFKATFHNQIEKFKVEYARSKGSGEKITDAEILREVLNSIGKKGRLGEHIRCVVSVSMLTEGWDCQTVTHIMGLRAFGSQLLCEQVVGRALRRGKYVMRSYDKNDLETTDGRKINNYKFSPEYAHIISVPFEFATSRKKLGSSVGGTTNTPVQIYAMAERTEKYEITFPQVVAYRVQSFDETVKADFSKIDKFEINKDRGATKTTMSSGFEDSNYEINLETLRQKRKQEIVYKLTAQLIDKFYTDKQGLLKVYYFRQLKPIVEYWYENKIVCHNNNFPQMVWHETDRAIQHIKLGIIAGKKPNDVIYPVFNYYNPIGSTKGVQGITTRKVFQTKKSHINYVVADTDSWEQQTAKAMEQNPQVLRYVKNAFLHFTIPYVDDNGNERNYYPDFLAVIKTKKGEQINLIIEVTGMNQDKEFKRAYVHNYWIPAVNQVRHERNYHAWHFAEITDTINIINELQAIINAL